MNSDIKKQIMALIRGQQFEQAKVNCAYLCDQQPDDPEAWFLLGALCGQLGDFSTAEQYFNRSAELHGGSPMTWYNLGIAQLRLGKSAAALASLQKAVRLNPAFAAAWVTLGNLHTSQGRMDDSLKAHQHALTAQPGMVEARAGIAEIYERQGDYAQAYRELKPFLEANNVPACAAIVLGKIANNLELQQQAIDVIKTVLNHGATSTVDAQQLHFRLGDLFDGQCRYDDAFAAYKTANELLAPPYDEQGRAEYFQQLVTTFNSDTFPHMARASRNFRQHVFIVGMPRSGTSLVEQMLASHRNIRGGGELPGIGNLVASFTSRFGASMPYPAACKDLGRNDLNSLAQTYLMQLEKIAPQGLWVTDKMPQNFLHLGLIDLLFPGARIIHCRRNPLDTCLSIYFHNFNATHPYANDLTSLGTYHRAYQELMQHWFSTLRIPVLDVQYEAMVADPEGVGRSMIDFCDLPWDSQCLRFYESNRHVETLSYDQVRRPVYHTSVDRWKLYERHLGPLREALLPANE